MNGEQAIHPVAQLLPPSEAWYLHCCAYQTMSTGY